MEPPKCFVELLKLHKDIAILRQQWGQAAHQHWARLNNDERHECLRGSPKDTVSELLLPAWNINATGGASTNLFYLLDSAGEETLLRQVSLLSSKFNNDADLAKLIKLLTGRARFQECIRFFKYNGVSIRLESGRFDHCCKDVKALLKFFASMPPGKAAVIMEKLFLLHQNLRSTMRFLVQHLEHTNSANKTGTNQTLQNKKQSIWQLSISKALIFAVADARDPEDHLGRYAQKVMMPAKISSRMKSSATHISRSIRTTIPAFVEARHRAIRTQPGLMGNEASIAATLDDFDSSASKTALFDMFHEAIRYSAMWSYLHSVLMLLRDRTADGVFRTLAIRELAEVSRCEFQRAKAALQRFAEADVGPRLMVLATAADYTGNVKGLVRVTAKDLNEMDDQLLAVLVQFCRRSTTPARAAQIFHKWVALEDEYAEEMLKLSQDTHIALLQLGAIMHFTQICTAVISMDPNHRFRNQSFVPRFDKLQKLLHRTKDNFSQHNFVGSDDMLVEKIMARTFFYEVEEFTKRDSGTSLSAHYEELVAASISDLKQRCKDLEAELGTKVNIKFDDWGEEEDGEEDPLAGENETRSVATDEPTGNDSSTGYVVDSITEGSSDDDDSLFTGTSLPSWTDDESSSTDGEPSLTDDKSTAAIGGSPASDTEQCLLHELESADEEDTSGKRTRMNCSCALHGSVSKRQKTT